MVSTVVTIRVTQLWYGRWFPTSQVEWTYCWRYKLQADPPITWNINALAFTTWKIIALLMIRLQPDMWQASRSFFQKGLLFFVGVGAGRIGPNLHVFHNSLRSERVWNSRSATRIVNGQSAGPWVVRIGTGLCGFGFFFSGPKTRKIIHNLVNPI